MSILFISGINDQSKIGVDLDEQGRPVYLMDGNASVQFRLPMKEGVGIPYTLFGLGVKQPMPVFKEAPSLVFNQIADADSHTGALTRCVELCSQLPSSVINHPNNIRQTQRDTISRMLADIPSVHMPSTIRIQPASPGQLIVESRKLGIDFPMIARVAGDHRGKSMVLLESPADLPGLHALPFDSRDFYVTEFIDYRANDGYCHKQRIMVVDGQPILRHAMHQEDWVVHASSHSFMKLHEDRREYELHFDKYRLELLPALQPAIEEITRRIKLEYYGIDCCMRDDGSMLVFEANANMNVITPHNSFSAYHHDVFKQAVYDLLQSYSGESVI